MGAPLIRSTGFDLVERQDGTWALYFGGEVLRDQLAEEALRDLLDACVEALEGTRLQRTEDPESDEITTDLVIDRGNEPVTVKVAGKVSFARLPSGCPDRIEDVEITSATCVCGAEVSLGIGETEQAALALCDEARRLRREGAEP